MKKKFWVPLVCVALFLFVCGIFLGGKNITVGLYYNSTDGHFLITDSPMHMTARKETFSHLNIGDRILVLHGPVAESYPTQTKVYFKLKLQDGTSADAQFAQAQMDRVMPTIELPTEPPTICGLPHPTVTAGRMILSVPDQWQYEIDEERPTITLWLDQDKDNSLCFFYSAQWGVCGTGLETQDITLPSGLTGSMGTYDKKPYWSYIALDQHVITLQCDAAWWNQNADQIMEIVNSFYLSANAYDH